MSILDEQPVGEYPVLNVIPRGAIDLAAARINELTAEVESLKALNERQTNRLAVWIGREAAES